MKQNKIASAVLITVSLVFFATFSAWAEAEQDTKEAALTAAEKSTPADAVDSAEVAEPTGLDIVLDGSSLKAFDKSLEQIKETASPADYQSLEGAIDYLLVYDLGAQRSREKLAARLNGKTGNEIINKVHWRKPR
jgi:outer membrane lipoprotein-sorting protein